MPEPMLEGAASILLSHGFLGVAVAALSYYIFLQRAELRDAREQHKLEIAAKDQLINNIQEARLVEARAGIEVIKTMQTTLDAFLSAVRVGRT
jgi:hypothetical protein